MNSYQATDPQLALWYDHIIDGQSCKYNVIQSYSVQNEICSTDVVEAMATIVQRHDTFRTTYHLRSGLVCDVEDAKTAGDTLRAEYLDRLREVYARETLTVFSRHPFNLSIAPLLRFRLFRPAPGQDWLLTLATHHIAVDHQSLVVIEDELSHLLRAGMMGGNAAANMAPAPAYGDYARRRGTSSRATREEVLPARVPGTQRGSALTRNSRSYPCSQSSAYAKAQVPGTTQRQLEFTAQRRAISVFSVLAACAVYAFRETCVDAPLALMIPFSLRADQDARLVGYCLNPAVILIDDPRANPLELAHGIFDSVLEQLDHPVPAARVWPKLREWGLSDIPRLLVQVLYEDEGKPGHHEAPGVICRVDQEVETEPRNALECTLTVTADQGSEIQVTIDSAFGVSPENCIDELIQSVALMRQDCP